jgi:hypothetical protein
VKELLDSLAARAVLERATRDLLYMSESDEPIEVIHPGNPGRPFGATDAFLAAGRPPGGRVRELRIEDFFGELTKECKWHGDSERETVNRYRQLRELFTGGLGEAKVFRLGEIEVDLIVIGRAADDHWIGIKTRAIET